MRLTCSSGKTRGSAAVLALPDICLTALKLRAVRQATSKSRAAGVWLGHAGPSAQSDCHDDGDPKRGVDQPRQEAL
jgi:hypothetical protein